MPELAPPIMVPPALLQTNQAGLTVANESDGWSLYKGPRLELPRFCYPARNTLR
jgi:hypothetical protein